MKKYEKPIMAVSKFEVSDSLLTMISGGGANIGGGIFDGGIAKSSEAVSSDNIWQTMLSDGTIVK